MTQLRCTKQNSYGVVILKKENVSLQLLKKYVYEWRMSHNDIIKFIDCIKPYMIIPYKISQIELALERYKNGTDDTYQCNFCENICQSIW